MTQNFPDFNPDLADFFKPLFSVELWTQISRAFDVLEDFDVPDLYESYTDLTHLFDQVETDDLRDRFYLQVVSQLKYVLRMHSVIALDTMPIMYLNELCEFFMNIQHMESYDAMYTMFTGFKTNEEIFYELLEEHTFYPATLWAQHIESFEPILIELLKNMAEQKMGIVPVETDEQKIQIKKQAFINMSVFGSHIEEHALGVQLAMMQMLMGQPLSTYINLSKDNLVSNPSDQDMALDFLSLCLISKEMQTNPYTLWSQYSDTLELPLAKAMKIGNILNDKFLQFTQLLKAHNEQD